MNDSRASVRVFTRFAFALAVVLAGAVSCTKGDRIVGEDFVPEDADVSDVGDVDDAAIDAGLDVGDGSIEAASDGAVELDADASTCSGTCLPSGAACFEISATETCPTSHACCITECPTLSLPSPSFCDGGPYAALYAPLGCVVGYACAPADCASAGGACVVAGACANGKVGNESSYACSGNGTVCCLP